MADDDLSDFERDTFTYDGKTRTVFRKGTGPAVIVISEMPGISPKVLEFARSGRRDRMHRGAAAPVRRARRDADPNTSGRGKLDSGRYLVSSIVPACISREFTVLRDGQDVAGHRVAARAGASRARALRVVPASAPWACASRVDSRSRWPRSRVSSHRCCRNRRCRPALTKKSKHAIDISNEDLDIVKGRCAAEGLTVLGLRFKGDRNVPKERFEFLREQLGDAFVAVELEDEHANPDAAMSPHSVLTEHLIDEPGQPTRDALDQVLDLFRTRLLTTGG